MLSGWYRATSPCRATASACYNTHTHAHLRLLHHICWCRLQPAVRGSCKVQDGASLVCMYTSDESWFRVLLPPFPFPGGSVRRAVHLICVACGVREYIVICWCALCSSITREYISLTCSQVGIKPLVLALPLPLRATIHTSACHITFAGVACNQRCVAVAKCRTALHWYVHIR